MLLLLLAWLSGCVPVDETDETDETPSPEVCDLAAEAAETAGPGATDCGSVAPDDDATAALACAADAFTAGAPFYVLVARQGTDSILTSATLGDGARVWRFDNDNLEGDTDISGVECLDPYVGTDGVIACTSTAPEGNEYAVCGAHEGENPAPLPFDP